MVFFLRSSGHLIEMIKEIIKSRSKDRSICSSWFCHASWACLQLCLYIARDYFEIIVQRVLALIKPDCQLDITTLAGASTTVEFSVKTNTSEHKGS